MTDAFWFAPLSEDNMFGDNDLKNNQKKLQRSALNILLNKDIVFVRHSTFRITIWLTTRNSISY